MGRTLAHCCVTTETCLWQQYIILASTASHVALSNLNIACPSLRRLACCLPVRLVIGNAAGAGNVAAQDAIGKPPQDHAQQTLLLAPHSAASMDHLMKKLGQKKYGMTEIVGVEEINMFRDNGEVLHFVRPQSHNFPNSNTVLIQRNNEYLGP